MSQTVNQYTVASNLNEMGLLQLVDRAEAHFEEQVLSLADRLASSPELHLIGLTGPTCSGKTTAAEILTRALKKHGKTLHVISFDDFYYNKSYLHELAVLNGREEPDYDSEETIDLELLAQCTKSLLAGKPTQMPRFNFQSGEREAGDLIDAGDGDLFLFEGIQLLYPGVRKILVGGAYQSIYIYPQSSIEVGGQIFTSNEIRLLRRLVRDYHFRGTSAEFTLLLWRSVRENEENSIFPYVGLCDHRIDSTMPYEIGILKPYLEEILPTVTKSSPYASLAKQLLSRLKDVQPVPVELLPEHSLYEEFI